MRNTTINDENYSSETAPTGWFRPNVSGWPYISVKINKKDGSIK